MTTQILALDDEPTILTLYQSILEPAGYQLMITGDSREALVILQSHTIDLFIQDFQRPEINGREMLKLLQADPRLRAIPVLLITADTREDRARELELDGLNWDTNLQGYLQKPFGAGDLLDLVEAVLQKYEKPLPPLEKRGKERQWWNSVG